MSSEHPVIVGGSTSGGEINKKKPKFGWINLYKDWIDQVLDRFFWLTGWSVGLVNLLSSWLRLLVEWMVV